MKHPHVNVIKHIVKDLDVASAALSVIGFQRTEARL